MTASAPCVPRVTSSLAASMASPRVALNIDASAARRRGWPPAGPYRQHLPRPPLDRPSPGTRDRLGRDESEIGPPREVVRRRLTGRAALDVYARAEIKWLHVAGGAPACNGGKAGVKAPWPGIRKRPGHERPAAIFGGDPAFGGQVVVGGEDRIAIDAQRTSQFSRARHWLAGPEPAPSDIARDSTRDLRKDWQARLGIDGNREVPSAHVTLFSAPPRGGLLRR